jgi:hypothetical protein
MAYIGLSLSLCVTDIAAGVIPLDEVVGIRASTAFTDKEGWERLIAHNRNTYWAFAPDRCELIARRLLANEGIIQPRLEGKEANNVAAGRWEKDGVLLPDSELRAMYEDQSREQQRLEHPFSTVHDL